MAESGTYDLATIQRRQKLAEQMLARSSQPQRIDHWAQGLAHLANVGADTYQLNRLDKQEKAAKAAEIASVMGMLGGSPAAPAAAPPAAPAGGDVTGRIVAAENATGDPAAKNPNSSAMGDGQFINSTWLETIKKARPDLVAGKDDATLLAMRSDPALSKEMTDQYATGNRKFLADRGLPVTPGSTYLAHFAGPGGAQKVLSADPKTRVAELLSPAAIKANAFLAPMTAGDLTGWADRKMGGAAPPRAAVAEAMAPGAGAPAAASGGILANATPDQRRAIAAGLSAREGSPARAIAMSMLQKLTTPRDQWIDERGPDGSFYQRNALTGERKVIEKSDVLPAAAVTQKIDIARAGKPDTVINNTVNPILKGVGESFIEQREAARASVPQIEGIFEARKALDQGAITGLGADPKLFLTKAANLFGLGGEAAANTEVLRSSIGNSVLAKAKTLGANPSNADRDYIEKVVGGSIALEEASMRRLLDMQEKWARAAIRRANADGQKLLKAQPKELGAISPLLGVDEPPTYEEFLKANPIAAPSAPARAPAAPAGGVGIDDLLKKYGPK